MNQRYTCAVTGGSGFIGSHVVDALVDAGHRVIVIDYGSKPHRPDVEYREADIVNFESVLAALEGVDYVYHLAAMASVAKVLERPVLAMNVNLMGTVHVLEAARIHKCKRVFFASTVWVYSACHETDVDETSPFHLPGAGHTYSSSKMAAEFLLHDYWNLYQVPFTIFRYGIPYGPRMWEALAVPSMLKRVFEKKPIQITGSGQQFRDFVFVKDLARAHVLGLKPDAENQVFNLEGMERISILQIAQTIQTILGSDRVQLEFVPDRPGDYKGKSVSKKKTAERLGWRATTGFNEGMKETVDYFSARFDANISK